MKTAMALFAAIVALHSSCVAQDSGKVRADKPAQIEGAQVTEFLVLRGSVVDSQGLGIAGAEVELRRSGATSVFKARSDSSGDFQFRAVVPGNFVLIVSAPGFERDERAITLESDSSIPLLVTLKPGATQSTVTVTGENESLLATRAAVGSLTDTSLMDLPQSVEVATRALLDQQSTYQYADSLTYLSGVQRAYTTIEGGLGNEVAMRGFNLDYNNNYLRDGYKFYGLSLSDTADIESIEVLKGPASALYGTAEAGGIVNLVSKKPAEDFYSALSMNGGSYRFLRPDFDISGPINASKNLLYRVNGVYENSDTFRDYISHRERFIAPFVLWKIGPATSLSAQAEVINVDRNSDYGLVLYGDRVAPVPVSTSYTEPWNNEADRDRQGGYRFRHDFQRGWTFTNGLQISRTNASYLEVYTTGPDTDPTLLTRQSDAFSFPTLYRYSQSYLTGLRQTGPLLHHFAVGFEAGWVSQSSLGPGGYAPDVSVLHPIVGSDFSRQDAITALANPYFSLTYKSLYHNQSGVLQDQIDLGSHWKGIVGLRAENYFQNSIDLSSNSSQTQSDVPVSPRAGLVYQPASWVSLYGSYVRSFIPTSPSAISSSGKQFSPERDHQWESGVKFAPLEGRLTATIALYQIEKSNVLAPDPQNPIFSVQNGQVRSKGLEFEMAGSPMAGLNVLLSYAFTQAQVTRSTEYPIGNLLPNAARHLGATWVNWQSPSGPLKHLGISGGLVATSYREDNYYASAQLPGYARLDAGAFYELPIGRRAEPRQRLRMHINAQNLLDKRYSLASNGQDQIRPGSPRSFLSGMTWIW